MLSWKLFRSLENSLADFLTAQITADAVTDINGNAVSIRVGREFNTSWTLPCITLYYESETASRFEIGSNKRDDRQLIIIDIFATNEGERLDVAKWLTDTINDGWRYYTYTANPGNPDSPTKVAGGWVNVDFVTNGRVALGQDVDQFEAHRHQISINIWISGS